FWSLTQREQQVVSEQQLVDKKGGSYTAVAPRLEPGKFNKWKKCMLYYLMGMEPYYIQCINNGSFKPKTAQGDAKPENQWTKEERRVVNQDQRLKNIIISCLPDEIIESAISCGTDKDTWTDLVHSFEGPFDTKENRIMDLKLEYQMFRAKPYETLSQTYTHYKTLLNELANDGVNLSKHKIDVGFVNSLPERYLDTQKALITAPSTSQISTAFFSNNIVQDFQEIFDDEADERSSEEYLRDLNLEFHERALLANSKRFIKKKNNFSIQKANEDTECYKCGKKKMKAKLALLKANPPISQPSKPFQLKNKGLIAERFDWDKEEVSDAEETRVQVLMALADDELSVGKNHARNGE
ncbi:hypothetical protein Tco_1412113, partial [Tanacetum coccineum]